jgi:hypothetical protein
MFLTPWHAIKTDFSLVELAIANLQFVIAPVNTKDGEHRSELSSVEDRNRSKFKIPTVQVKRNDGGFRGFRELRNRMARNLNPASIKNRSCQTTFNPDTACPRAPTLVGFARDLRQQSVFISVFRLRA